MMRLLLAILLLLPSAPLAAQNPMTLRSPDGMVVSASADASRAGAEILRQGGNAVDAAVATAFAMAVTHPQAGNIGGSIFLVIRMEDGRSTAIDARETAPAAASADMYLDGTGEPVHDMSLYGPIAAGVPGSVDGLLLALEKYGTMSRAEVMRPAIRLASEGFALHPRLASFLKRYLGEFERYPETFRVFSNNGTPYRPGDLLRQPDLANTLERIAADGRDGFYSGETARLIVEEMRRNGGLITLDDLAGYHAIEREPLRGTYRGYDIISMPPVSSGGVALLQMLGMLEHFDLGSEVYTARTVHLMVEAMRRAFADRASWLGDPAFTDIPMDRLLSKTYLDALARGIDPNRATRSTDIDASVEAPWDGTETTHYSVTDRWGNAVAATTTINSHFGGKCMVTGAGFLLNNEMDDFSVKPGVPNQFGLLGNEANSIQPGKRMLSSMTPTIMLKNGTLVLLTGSPGGSRIISTTLETIVNVVDLGMAPEDAVSEGRFHHQWYPDTVYVEPDALDDAVLEDLRGMGHHVLRDVLMGRVHAIGYDAVRREYVGCADPRAYGGAAAP